MISAPSGVLVLGSDRLEIPAGLPSPAQAAGEVVLLLADSEVSDSGWAARVAIELSRHWANSGLRVILADGDLPLAPLHTEVGVENEEGVADLLLYGSSPYRVARRVEGEEYLLITAGTVVADPERVYRHERWQGLLAAFRESGCVLVLYLPTDLPGHSALLSEGDRVLRLCGSAPSEAAEPGVLVLVPEVGLPRTIPVAAVPELDLIRIDLEDDESEGTLLQAVEEVEREARAAAARRAPIDSTSGTMDPTPVMDSGAADVELAAAVAAAAASVPGATPRPVATRKAPWILFAVLLIVGAILVLGWLGYLPLPGSPVSTSGGPAVETPVTPFTILSPFG